MEPPINGMTTTPYGSDHQAGPFLAFVCLAYEIEENRIKFKAETGIDIVEIVKALGVRKEIDRVTGRQRDALVKFADWVTVNLWGEDGRE